ncbi:MAG: hypothetical protein K5985_04465 [Lachnospiraceae bacterium]|nr:hypothetical protein [Lachnospiraceae bacterium]
MNGIRKLFNSAGLHEWYYPLMMACYALTLLSFRIFRPGVFSAVLLVLIWISLFTAGMMPKIKKDMDAADFVMGAWLLYSLFSGIWTVSFGIPFKVFLGEVFTTALPMGFYYAGKKGDKARFYRNFILAVLAIGLLGLVLYITAPKFYVDFLFEHEFISKATVKTMRVRMVSVIGSTLMGYLSVVSMLLSSVFLIRAKGKQGKAAFILSLFLAFMSNQRAAMVAAILVLIYLNCLLIFVYGLLGKKLFFAECGGIICLFVLMLVFAPGALLKVYYRLVSLPGAVTERSDQWVGAANNLGNMWLGNGLGANGHRAIGFSEHVIADGGIAKLCCEMGIIGTSIFIFLLVLVLGRGIRHFRECSAELGVILITLLISIGSDTLSFALSVPVLYYCIGVVSATETVPAFLKPGEESS